MGKARLKTGERKDIFLYKTRVENLFINEFLPDAPGDCVKVFLFGLMYAQYNQQIDSRTMALTLGITEKDVDNAWKYWESKGLVILTPDGEGGIEEIEFVRQIDLFYGKTLEESYPVNGEGRTEENPVSAGELAAEEPDTVTQDSEESADSIIERLINRQLRDMFRKYEMLTGRTLSTHEAGKLTDSIKVYNIEPDVLDFAIDYCIGIDKTSIDYICKVALRWTEDGARDVGAVKQMLDRRSKRNDAYRKVFAELGFSRLPNPADREIMDRWFDEMGCALKDVLDACKAAGGVRDPNLRYVNKVLENRILEKGGINTRTEQMRKASAEQPVQAGQPAAQESARVSRKVLRDYYDYIRSEGEKDRKARLTEVMNRIPEMRDIFSAETQINSLVITMKPGPDAKDKRQRLKDRRQEIEEKKRTLLTDNGYPEDYLERKYRCDICKDTGYTDEGRVCTCAKERAEEAYEWISRTGNR